MSIPKHLRDSLDARLPQPAPDAEGDGPRRYLRSEIKHLLEMQAKLVEALKAALPKCDHVVDRDTGRQCGSIAVWSGSFSSHYCDEHRRGDNVLMEVAAQGVAALASTQEKL